MWLLLLLLLVLGGLGLIWYLQNEDGGAVLGVVLSASRLPVNQMLAGAQDPARASAVMVYR